MGNILIKNTKYIDTEEEKIKAGSILVSDGKIKKIFDNVFDGEELEKALNSSAFKISDFDGRNKDNILIDGSGLIVSPGLIDMHVHFRDPGQTEKETLETGEKAAAHGGFTTVCAMPNTTPPIDSLDKYLNVTKRADEIGLTKVLQVGAMTKGMEGKELSEMSEMASNGLKAFSEDGKSVMDSALFYSAMEKAAELKIPVLSHCEDKTLVRNGVMNYGVKSKALGLKGITNSVENIITFRDIDIARETGASLHLCHVSTKEAAELLLVAKDKGIDVTGEVCPHHFILTEDDIPSKDDAFFKMNPPLRTKEDRSALLEGLKEDIFDIISTDHAPHTLEEKSRGFEKAPFGIVGLETSFPLSYTYLVERGILSLPRLIKKMSTNPAKRLKIDRGVIKEGKAADLMIFDPSEEFEINSDDFFSKGRNTPFEGYKVKGRVKYTIFGGKIVYSGL